LAEEPIFENQSDFSIGHNSYMQANWLSLCNEDESPSLPSVMILKESNTYMAI
jgi:hypothetical protein